MMIPGSGYGHRILSGDIFIVEHVCGIGKSNVCRIIHHSALLHERQASIWQRHSCTNNS